MESARVRDFHTSWWNIWSRTSERSEQVRFLILHQRVWKSRTKRFPCCNLFVLYILWFSHRPKYILAPGKFELWKTRVHRKIILSQLPDKSTCDDREKARENTIRLNRGLWLDETIFCTCEKLVSPLWLVEVKSETLFYFSRKQSLMRKS